MSKYTKKSKGAFYKPEMEDLFNFNKKMDELGFSRVSKEDILISVVGDEMKKPDRATAGNVLQVQYRYTDKGYTVHIHTGLIDDEFSEKGSSWVLILDQKNKRVWSREFYRNIGGPLLLRLSSFAHLAKNIIESRMPMCELIEVSETKYAWRDKIDRSISKYFTFRDYLYNLSTEEKRIVSKRENNRILYLEKTEGKVRRERTFRKKWKK